MPKKLEQTSDHICEYCFSGFATKPNLLRHQRTSKACKMIREGSTIVSHVQLPYNFTCEGCNKSFTLKHNLKQHQNKCIAYTYIDIKTENIRLREENKRLREENEYLKKNPQTINNNNKIITYNIVISEDHIRKFLPDLTTKHLENGARGIAHFALQGPFSQGVKCVDFSRRVLEYLDESGRVRKDIGGRRAIAMLFQSIQQDVENKIEKLIEDEKTKTYDDDDIFTTVNTVCKGKRIGKYYSLLRDVDEAAKGIKSEFTMDFITEVCELIGS